MEIINKIFNKAKKFLPIILGIIFLVVFYILLPEKRDDFVISKAKISDVVIELEVVSTPALMARGLSGRESLDESTGMLFVFEKSGINYFWMKDMNFPIDIIWIDENFRIIYIEKGAQPESFPNPLGPKQESRYVLETIAGFSEKNNLEVGDLIEFLP